MTYRTRADAWATTLEVKNILVPFLTWIPELFARGVLFLRLSSAGRDRVAAPSGRGVGVDACLPARVPERPHTIVPDHRISRGKDRDPVGVTDLDVIVFDDDAVEAAVIYPLPDMIEHADTLCIAAHRIGPDGHLGRWGGTRV